MELTNAEIIEYLSHTPIGAGTEAVIYDAGKYILRLPIHIKNDLKFKNSLFDTNHEYKKVKSVHWRRNFGQPIYNIIDKSNLETVLSICKKINGFPTNNLVEPKLTKQQIIDAQEIAITKMKLIASAPISSYQKLIDDLNYLTQTDFTIDPSEGNMLINQKSKKFYIIDLRYIKKIRNIGDLILLLLTDIPNMPQNQIYYDLELKIINKLIYAANSRGLVHPDQLKLKTRALEVIKSPEAKKAYIDNHHNIRLKINTHFYQPTPTKI
ncbi:MAG: hypothetical protein MJ187_04055 [Alphaproteobacteria bacterium]|nr:hypothetical protein [Alphaproteobacteria bacterium]